MYTVIDLRHLFLRAVARLRFLPALLARAGLGIVFVQTGWGKLHALDQVTEFFRSLGIPFPELLEIAGGVRGGRKLKAVIPGGSSCPVIPAEKMMTLTMDFDTIKAAGSGLGTCASIIMDETTCMVRMLRRISRFYHAESCGQCTPCREGTGWLHRVLTRIIEGKGTKADIDMLVDVANKIEGHTICAFGDAAAWPVQSFIKHFRHEFEYMVEHKGRSIVDDLPSVAA